MQGKFITLEALDGVGKTTAMKAIVDTLTSLNIDAVTTREPGGTQRGEAIRSILLDPAPTEPLCSDAEMLLMFAARAQHLHEKIRPALERSQWVVSDRHTDSTYAYQGGGRGISCQRIELLEHFVVGGLQPDLTILLDLPEAAAHERLQKRLVATGEQKDRFELEEDSFFSRVRQAYLDRAKQYPARFVIINAALPIGGVEKQVSRCLKEFYKLHQDSPSSASIA